MNDVATHRPRGVRTHVGPGFTLIELMVVAAIIAVLLTLTVPAMRSLIQTNQRAQAENQMRSVLLSARSYAMKHRVVAGVRFQEDGNMVQVYASNYDEQFTMETHWEEGIVYQMRAIDGVAPQKLPDPWRVTTLDIAPMDHDLNPQSYWLGTWTSAPEWTDTEHAWFVHNLALFDASGRLVLAQAQFPEDWHPNTDEAFGRLTGSDVTWAHQPYRSVPQGPHVTASIRLFDYFAFRGAEDLESALLGMSATASDSYINMNTGMIVRNRTDMDMGN